MISRWKHAALLASAALTTALGGCASRLAPFPTGQAPTATLEEVSVTVTAIHRTEHAVELAIRIDNRSGQSIVVPRHYRDMSGILLTDGTVQVTGQRRTSKRTISPNRYTILTGEQAELELEFADPALAASGALHLMLQAARGDHPLSLTLPIPAAPSLNPNP